MLIIDFPYNSSGMADVLEIELNFGKTYQIQLHSVCNHDLLLHRLLSLPHSALIATEGGMISNLTTQENILLPVRYHSLDSDAQALQRAASILECLDLSADEIHLLFSRMPSELSVFEKRLINFARSLIMEPEILVCDTIFDGLTKHEMSIIGRFSSIFHRYFPFRTLIYLELDFTQGIIHADKIFELS